MRPLEIRLLGGFEIHKRGRPPPELPTQKIKSLFAYLVTHRHRSHPREVLAELFWGELGAEKAKNNLRYTLSILHHELAPYLVIERHQVSFNTESHYWLDVEEFENHIKRSRSLSGEERFQVLRQALDLYRGDFLAGFYDDWVFAEQKHFEMLYLEALDAVSLWPAGPFLGSPALGKLEEAGLKRELARAHNNLRRPETALAFAEQALKLYEQAQDLAGQSDTHLLLGVIHRHLGQNAQARDYYQRALALSRKTTNMRTEWRALNNLGWLEWNLHHSLKAQIYYKQALPLCCQTGERQGVAIILDNWGIAHLDSKAYTKALECFDQAYEVISALGDKELELENLSYRALAHLGMKEVYETRRCMDQVLELLDLIGGIRFSHKAQFNIWRVLWATGCREQAREHLQLTYEHIMAWAQKIYDPALRDSFLQGDRTNREILKAWQTHSAQCVNNAAR